MKTKTFRLDIFRCGNSKTVYTIALNEKGKKGFKTTTSMLGLNKLRKFIQNEGRELK